MSFGVSLVTWHTVQCLTEQDVCVSVGCILLTDGIDSINRQIECPTMDKVKTQFSFIIDIFMLINISTEGTTAKENFYSDWKVEMFSWVWQETLWRQIWRMDITCLIKLFASSSALHWRVWCWNPWIQYLRLKVRKGLVQLTYLLFWTNVSIANNYFILNYGLLFG